MNTISNMSNSSSKTEHENLKPVRKILCHSTKKYYPPQQSRALWCHLIFFFTAEIAISRPYTVPLTITLQLQQDKCQPQWYWWKKGGIENLDSILD